MPVWSATVGWWPSDPRRQTSRSFTFGWRWAVGLVESSGFADCTSRVQRKLGIPACDCDRLVYCARPRIKVRRLMDVVAPTGLAVTLLVLISLQLPTMWESYLVSGLFVIAVYTFRSRPMRFSLAVLPLLVGHLLMLRPRSDTVSRSQLLRHL